MRKSFALLIVAVTVAVSIPAFAELQNVQVGGSLRIRGNYWTSEAGPDSLTQRNPLINQVFPFGLAGYTQWRGVPGGNPAAGLRWPGQPGRNAVVSPVGWDKRGHGVKFVEQKTKLNVKADFTESVSAFVELDSYDIWGEDFRSNYINGADGRAVTNTDVEVYQSYIEANEMFGYPLRLRVGRQEIKLGSGWLVGTNDAGSFFTGLSFDGIRATYATDQFSVDAIWAKLAGTNPAVEEDADTDMYALYGSYLGIENITLDAYWIWVRDAAKQFDTNRGWLGEWWEDVLNVDDYDVTNLHTIGLRGAGTYGALDFEAELAYQFGDAGSVGSTFQGQGLLSPYGPDGASFSNWAGNLQVGYTFDMDYTPRVYGGAAYFGGEDNRDVNFWQWLGAVACPYWHADSSVSFNRLFSDWQYGNFVGAQSHDCTNLWLAYVGVSAMPVENLKLDLSVAYVQSLEDFSSPWATFWLFGSRITLFPNWTFLSDKNADDLCWDLNLKATYNYSEDLSFEAGWSHIFVGDGASDGNFNIGNGLAFEGGTANDDADYFYFETKLCF